MDNPKNYLERECGPYFVGKDVVARYKIGHPSLLEVCSDGEVQFLFHVCELEDIDPSNVVQWESFRRLVRDRCLLSGCQDPEGDSLSLSDVPEDVGVPKVGDVVCLKSGGPRMTVVGVEKVDSGSGYLVKLCGYDKDYGPFDLNRIPTEALNKYS